MTTPRTSLHTHAFAMISPDILKHSGSAGLFGFAIMGAVFVVLPSYRHRTVQFDADVESEEARPEATGEVEYVPAPERPQLERAPTPSSADSDAPSASMESTSDAELEARNRAARRAMDRLEAIYDDSNDGAATNDEPSPSSNDADGISTRDLVEAIERADDGTETSNEPVRRRVIEASGEDEKEEDSGSSPCTFGAER